MPNDESVNLGIAWYRRDQWQKLLAASVDNEDLEDTFEDWEAGAAKKYQELRLAGKKVEKIEVDIDQLLSWCQQNKLPLTASSRARFVAERMRARGGA